MGSSAAVWARQGADVGGHAGSSVGERVDDVGRRRDRTVGVDVLLSAVARRSSTRARPRVPTAG
ncbi:MAG: hypothetical protein ACRDTT_21145, partial [Pseudonocardiaceae bacterium]